MLSPHEAPWSLEQRRLGGRGILAICIIVGLSIALVVAASVLVPGLPESPKPSLPSVAADLKAIREQLDRLAGRVEDAHVRLTFIEAQLGAQLIAPPRPAEREEKAF